MREIKQNMRLQSSSISNDVLQAKRLINYNKALNNTLPSSVKLSFSGFQNKSINNEDLLSSLKAMTLIKPQVNVSFAANSDPLFKLKDKLCNLMKVNNIQTSPVISPGVLPGWPFFYFPEKNELIIDMRSMHTALYQGGEPALDTMVEAISKTLEINDKYGDKIINIYKASAAKYAIGTDKIPAIALCNISAPPLGSSSEDNSLILLNTHWLEEANEPEYILSEILSHELSHTKTQLLYGDLRSNGFNQSMNSDTDKAKHYQTIRNFMSMEQNTPDSMQYKMALKRIIDDVSKISGLSSKEMAIINLKALQEGKNECGKVLIVDALFNDTEKQAILGKVEMNKDTLQAYLNNTRFDKVREGFDNTYKKNCDEILARHNQLVLTQDHIKEGIVEIKDAEFKSKILAEKPEPVSDSEFKELHYSLRI